MSNISIIVICECGSSNYEEGKFDLISVGSGDNLEMHVKCKSCGNEKLWTTLKINNREKKGK